MKHTKGKWEIHPSTSESRAGFTLITKDDDSVGEVYGSDIEAQKLATLFASAPELLAFAQKWVEFRNGEDTDPKELWYMATQAITKAEGK